MNIFFARNLVSMINLKVTTAVLLLCFGFASAAAASSPVFPVLFKRSTQMCDGVEDGASFDMGCKARCTCRGGGVTCVSMCPPNFRAPEPGCTPVRVPDGRCCTKWVCEESLRLSARSAARSTRPAARSVRPAARASRVDPGVDGQTSTDLESREEAPEPEERGVIRRSRRCTYKGRVYSKGATWTDGKRQCTCYANGYACSS